jgi:SulP family sulfate permease
MGGTFAAALLLPLEYSIYIGVGLSLVMYIYTSAANLRVVQLDPLPDGHFRELPAPKTVPSAAPLILGVYGNLYFAAVSTLERQLPDPQAAETPVVILRLRGNEYLGSTGIRLLERYAAQLEQRGGKLMISGIGENIVGQLQRTGAWRRLGGAENIFPETDILLAATEKAYSCACAWLAKQRRALDAAEV